MSQDAAQPFSLISSAGTNATNVKAATAVLLGWAIYNTNAAARYLKIYNAAAAPTAGSGTPTLRITIPGNTAGAGSNIAMPPNGVSLSLGLGFTITGGAADNDTTAINVSEVLVNLFYQ